MSKKQRIEDLEVKVSYQEHLLSELNEVIVEMRDEIERLRSDLTAVAEQVNEGTGDLPGEKPPHY